MRHDWTPRGYAVDHLLGSGSTADVWRARILATGEAVALKRIPLEAGAAARADRAHAEARLLARLDHPNLVRLHDAVRTRDSLVLVLDLASRGSLRDLLAVRGRLTPGEVVTALAPSAAALAHLHERGVVHGDVSAANVLFTGDGTPMLADVGVARMVGEQRAAESTPAYVDPAVAAGRAPAPGSDVFMLAAVAFHALTGAPLWVAADGSPVAVLARAVGGVPGDVAARLAGAGVPDTVTQVLCRVLVDDPAARPSAVDLALDLRFSTAATGIDFDAGREDTRVLLPRFPASSADAASGDAASGDAAPAGTGVAQAGCYPPRSVLPAHPAPAQLAGRPGFQRPAPVAAVPQEPPTRMVSRQRPQIPRPAQRRVRPGRAALGPAVPRVPPVSGRHRSPLGRARHGAGRRIGVVAALLVCGSVALALAVTAGDGRSAADPAPQRRPLTSAPASPPPPSPAPMSSSPMSAVPVSPSTATPSRATRSPATPSPGRGTPRVAAWTAVLHHLDDTRADAYAGRRPDLLALVYAAPALLRADAARLRGSVPAGCGLRGVHTTYRVLTATGGSSGAELLVEARLSASTLVCHGATRATAPSAGPVRLRVELADTGAGPRIAALQAG